MNWMKPALVLSLLLFEITSCLEIAQAQLSPDRQVASEQKIPPVIGRPPEREPAGTRGPCQETNASFTPLLPLPKPGFSGYTLTGHPTFWFYVPYQTGSISSGKFSLEDQEGNSFYQTSFKLPQTPGFVSVSIPITEKPLEKGKQYRWTFTLSCTSQDPTDSPRVWHKGTVQRVDMPALETRLKTANSLEERINLYIENNIWYDAPTDLAKIQERSRTWRNLLRAMELEQLAQEAIAGSVVPIESGN
jgi:hypothetical protein